MKIKSWGKERGEGRMGVKLTQLLTIVLKVEWAYLNHSSSRPKTFNSLDKIIRIRKK